MIRTKTFVARTTAAAAMAGTLLIGTAGTASAALSFPSPLGMKVQPVVDGVVETTKGTATGDGPATQDDCDFFAGVANGYVKEAEGALLDGNDARALDFLRMADQVEDHAESEGCEIEYI